MTPPPLNIPNGPNKHTAMPLSEYKPPPQTMSIFHQFNSNHVRSQEIQWCQVSAQGGVERPPGSDVRTAGFPCLATVQAGMMQNMPSFHL